MNHARPRLPSRTPANHAGAAVLRLWRLGECTDPAVLARVAAGLRALPDHRPPTTSGGHENYSGANGFPCPRRDIQHRNPPAALGDR